jgi:cell division septum initiation protein DivIVA
VSESGGISAGGGGLGQLRSGVFGLSRGAVRSLVVTLDERIAAATREANELGRRVAELEAEIAAHREDEDLEAAIELSRQVASNVLSEAREQHERVVEEARREAERIEGDQPVELDDLQREVDVLRTQLKGRRFRLERTLRTALGELDSEGPEGGTATSDVGAALRAFRSERPQG